MASAKIVIRNPPNKDGTVSVILQIIHRRRVYPKAILKVEQGDWDPKRNEVRYRNRNAVKYNQIIADRLKEAKDYLLDCQLKRVDPDVDRFFKRHASGDNIVDRLEARARTFKNARTQRKYYTTIKRIHEAKLNTDFRNIDDDWIRKFTLYLKAVGNSNNTRVKYLGTVGSVMEEARKRREILINPFEGMPKNLTPSRKAKLTAEEFGRIRDLRCDGIMEDVRKLFVFAVIARGMRAHDVLTLTWNDLQGGRVQFQAQKSSEFTDGKWFDFELTDEMRELIGVAGRDEYVFPFIQWPKRKMITDENKYKDHVGSRLAVVNKYLKKVAEAAGIGKVISMHVARHTFAYMMAVSGVSIIVIQQLLGHSNPNVTRVYIEQLMEAEELDAVVRGRI